MRKYLTAAALGAVLIAGQAAASDSAVVNVDDRVGAQSATASYDDDHRDKWVIWFAGALFIGLVAYGFSQNGGGNPTSP
jgi:hypothetical protein